MKAKLKIAIFSGEIPSTTFVEHVIEGVSEHHEVYLYGVADKTYKYSSKSVKVYSTPKSHLLNFIITSYRVLRLLLKNPSDVITLIKEIKRFKSIYSKWIWFSKFLPIILYRPDVFHIQWTRDLEYYWFLKDRFRIKFIVSLLGSHINYTPLVQPYIADIYRTTFPKVDAFHAVSNAIAKEAQLYNAPLDKITLIHSPIKASTFANYRSLQPKRNAGIKLISVGRHHWVKGYKYALSAMQMLKQKNIDFHYTIIAQGNVPEELIFQRGQLGLEKEVTFLNGVAQEQLFKEMQNHDLLILSSLSEGIANVVLEAMAIGVPVISTNCGGMAEAVIPNETGWLVPMRSPQSIAEAVIEIIVTPEKEVQRITKKAHEFVKTQFNAQNSIGQFLELYDKVASNATVNSTATQE